MERREFLRAASGALVTGAAAPALLSGCSGGTSAASNVISTASPAPTPASQRALRALARQLAGRLLLPGVPGFAAENLPANDVYEDVTPQAIALCQTPATS